tara:strand:- start:1066 stop:1350 length:285 start_codon:yes stop_codon:yes gene_type:complete
MSNQELYGWSGNCIFTIAQLFQIYHTFKIKETKDISFGLQIFWLIGNIMYVIFGFFDKSQSLFIGSLITTITVIIQICQKIYYDYYHKKEYTEI